MQCRDALGRHSEAERRAVRRHEFAGVTHNFVPIEPLRKRDVEILQALLLERDAPLNALGLGNDESNRPLELGDLVERNGEPASYRLATEVPPHLLRLGAGGQVETVALDLCRNMGL